MMDDASGISCETRLPKFADTKQSSHVAWCSIKLLQNNAHKYNWLFASYCLSQKIHQPIFQADLYHLGIFSTLCIAAPSLLWGRKDEWFKAAINMC